MGGGLLRYDRKKRKGRGNFFILYTIQIYTPGAFKYYVTKCVFSGLSPSVYIIQLMINKAEVVEVDDSYLFYFTWSCATLSLQLQLNPYTLKSISDSKLIKTEV